MRYGKKTEPHPSKLARLSDEEIIALEKRLRELCDSWGWIISPKEEDVVTKPKGSSWMKEKPPGIRTFANSIKKAAGKIGRSWQHHGKKKTSAPD